MQLTILHTDADIIVVDKPGGLLSVPGRGPDKQDCVVNRLKSLFADIIPQPAVHRLDMYTSGVLIVARNAAAHKNLCRQFEHRQAAKTYIALVEGLLKASSGRIELRFRLDPDNRPYQIYDPNLGKTGITLWKKLKEENNRTRVEFSPLTGRTHQLRLHAAHPYGLNAPIVGDSLYGNGRDGDAMMLHAHLLSLQHPLTHQKMTFIAKVPF